MQHMFSGFALSVWHHSINFVRKRVLSVWVSFHYTCFFIKLSQIEITKRRRIEIDFIFTYSTLIFVPQNELWCIFFSQPAKLASQKRCNTLCHDFFLLLPPAIFTTSTSSTHHPCLVHTAPHHSPACSHSSCCVQLYWLCVSHFCLSSSLQVSWQTGSDQ